MMGTVWPIARPIFVGIPFVLIAVLISGCCTSEIGEAVGEAARDSMYAEQERIAQRAIQMEADTLAATTRMLESVSTRMSETMARNVEQTSEATSAAIERSTIAMQDGLRRTTEQNREILRDVATSVTEAANESQDQMMRQFRTSMREAVEDLGDGLEDQVKQVGDAAIAQADRVREQAADEEANAPIKRQAAEIAEETAERTVNKIGEQTRSELALIIEQVLPILIVVLAVQVMMMIVPTIALLFSYRSSTRAIRALRDLSSPDGTRRRRTWFGRRTEHGPPDDDPPGGAPIDAEPDGPDAPDTPPASDGPPPSGSLEAYANRLPSGSAETSDAGRDRFALAEEEMRKTRQQPAQSTSSHSAPTIPIPSAGRPDEIDFDEDLTPIVPSSFRRDADAPPVQPRPRLTDGSADGSQSWTSGLSSSSDDDFDDENHRRQPGDDA